MPPKSGKTKTASRPPLVEVGLRRLKALRLGLEYDANRDEHFIRGRDENGTMLDYRGDAIQILQDFGDDA